MCPKHCCTKTTRHAIIFFSILSFLLLPNAFNFNFQYSSRSNTTSNKPQSTKSRSGARDGIGYAASTSSSCPSNCNTTAMVDMATTFLYGVVFATLVAIIFNIVYTNPSSSSTWYDPKINTDDYPDTRNHHYNPVVGPSFSSLLGPTTSTHEERGGGGGGGSGVGYALLRTLPTFSYSKRSGARMGKGVQVCVICQSQLRNEQMVRWLPDCDHLFHLACIDQWLTSHSTCPCCRAHLNSPFTSDGDDGNFHYDHQHVYGYSTFPFNP